MLAENCFLCSSFGTGEAIRNRIKRNCRSIPISYHANKHSEPLKPKIPQRHNELKEGYTLRYSSFTPMCNTLWFGCRCIFFAHKLNYPHYSCLTASGTHYQCSIGLLDEANTCCQVYHVFVLFRLIISRVGFA
ncbi:hypothetical protein CEXT_466341 [Caerostris extrusa]|uniref:Uncharacterized protein n=1 Tax=Caerostris extrusa TaxID=172846 RepID=A0AAV4U8B3_CAEEX|nr:hypothetical protein CEXT_466341 [Caerostris extrusa]